MPLEDVYPYFFYLFIYGYLLITIPISTFNKCHLYLTFEYLFLIYQEVEWDAIHLPP